MSTVRHILLLLTACAVATPLFAQELEENLDEIIISSSIGSTTLSRTSTAVSVVSQRELSRSPYTNIIDAVASEPGVSQITTGSGISKPVIRGLGYNRVLVISDGVRQEGQQWGDEHGTEINAHSVNIVEILKGPASLMYGSDAMAGVLVFYDAPKTFGDTLRVEASADYQTNNGLIDLDLHLSGAPTKFMYDVRLSAKRSHDYHNSEDGYVFNTGFSERSASALMGLNHRAGYSQLRLSYYHVTPEMTEEDADEEGDKSYSIESPYQEVYHSKAVSTNSFNLSDDVLKVVVGYQQNRRQEYEEEEEPELDMLLHTVNYDVKWLRHEVEGLKLSAGINGMTQHNRNNGEELLIPDYNMADVGLFATIAKTSDRASYSAGLRYDHRRLKSLEMTEEDEEEVLFSAFSRRFNSLTGSAGVALSASDALTLRLNISRGFRAPNISELSSNGVHEGSLRYEVGSPDLKAENSLQFDLGADVSLSWLYGRLSLFANKISNYIFSERNSEGMYIDGYPVFEYTQGDARLLGGELSLDIHPVKSLHFDNGFSFVDAQQTGQTADARYLPLTPAPRWNSCLRLNIPEHKVLTESYIAVGVEVNAKQNHYYVANDTETATPAYTLLSASAGTDIKLGEHTLAVNIAGSNLTDKAYQSHLSRLKDAGIHNMGRNISLKLVFRN